MTNAADASVFSKAKKRFTEAKQKVEKILTLKRCEAIPFAQVLKEELDAITRVRKSRLPKYKQRSACSLSTEKAHDLGLLGLAFSGGGIRSATFNLGVLQALAKCEMLGCFDYLSTVSGGGYIGAWLGAWIQRHPKRLQGVIEALNPQLPPENDEAKPITFLRQYSNYLTPRLGLMSADTWTMASIWMRNSLLNLIILVAGGVAVIVVPLLLLYWFHQLTQFSDSWFMLIPETLLFFVSAVYVAWSLKWFDRPAVAVDSTAETHPKWVRRLVVLPTFVSAFFGIEIVSLTSKSRWQKALPAAPQTNC
jgi:hypothetical protein